MMWILSNNSEGSRQSLRELYAEMPIQFTYSSPIIVLILSICMFFCLCSCSVNIPGQKESKSREEMVGAASSNTH